MTTVKLAKASLVVLLLIVTEVVRWPVKQIAMLHRPLHFVIVTCVSRIVLEPVK
jgi:hypothetical protein